jgi:hypothetical protein
MIKKQIHKNLFNDIKRLIIQVKNNIAVSINSELSLLYYQIGKKINNEILNNKRAKYGKKIILELSENLTKEYGKGWSEKHLRHCLRTAEIFEDEKIFYSLRRELSWTHIRTLIYINEPNKREFYTRIAVNEHWSSRQLQERINSQLFERTLLSKKLLEMI